MTVAPGYIIRSLGDGLELLERCHESGLGFPSHPSPVYPYRLVLISTSPSWTILTSDRTTVLHTYVFVMPMASSVTACGVTARGASAI